MSIETVWTCDACDAPLGARRFVFSSRLRCINGEEKETARGGPALDLCGEACLLHVVKQMLEEIR